PKPRAVLQERQLHGVRRTVALLGDDQLRHAVQVFLLGLVAVHVHLFAIDERHHIGVLLDRARFAQVRKLRLAATLAATGRARARTSCTETLGVSSIKIGASASVAAASITFCRSSRPRKPEFSRCESTRACEHNMRRTSAPHDISSENTPTTLLSMTAAFSA